MRVLVVDDSALIRARLFDLLAEFSGVELDEAHTADEALSIARRRRPQLILLDIHMPGTSGLAVLPRLKAITPTPVVVVLTGTPTEAHRRSCLASGADYFFDKSEDFAAVVQSIVCPTGDEP